MKIFVAGATGTLGLPLVRMLVTRGYAVTGLTRSEAKQPILEKLGAEAVVADALDKAAITRAVVDARPDAVVHLLTAIPPRGPMRASDMAMTNLLRTRGTEYLLGAAIESGAKRIIAESMVFAYGFGDHGDVKLREEDLPDHGMQTAATRETSEALLSLEEQIRDAASKDLIEGISLRIGLLYGPDSPSTRFGLRMLAKRMYPVVGNGDGAKPWVHTDDAVAGIIAAIERGCSGDVYNIVDDEPASFSDFLRFAASAVGAPRPRAVPLWFVRLTSPYAAAAISTRLNVSNEKAKQKLAWSLRYPGYKEGIREIVSVTAREKKAA
jgi:nucleoside-diphosphate-sugar epimerase